MGVLNRVADVGVAQVALDDAEIRTPFCEIVTAGVPQHVGMGMEFSQAGRFCQPIDELANAPGRELSSTFGKEDEVARGWTVAEEFAQGSNFDAPEGVVARDRALEPPDMENPMVEIEVLPDGLQCLGNPKPVGEADQDQGEIAGRPPGGPGRFEKAIDFRRG